MVEEHYRIDVTYSSDDGGYYAEVWSTKTGRELHTTDVFPTADAAREAASRVIKDMESP
jgi:hypothetical protein